MALRDSDRQFPSLLTVTASTSRFFPVEARVLIRVPKAGRVDLDVVWEEKDPLPLVRGAAGEPPHLDCEIAKSGGHRLLATLAESPDGRQVLFGCVISRPSFGSGATGVWVAEADREDEG